MGGGALQGLTPGGLALASLVAGVFGAAAMESAMLLITRSGWARGNMVVALGSLVTRERTGAVRVGVVLHTIAALLFSTLYLLVMLRAGVSGLPAALAVGAGLGFLHGMVVSLLLIWIIAEHHPLAEFQNADLAIGLCHLAGHVAFGVAVGIVAGLALP